MMGIGPPPGFDPDDVTPPPLAERLWPVTSLALDVSGQCNLACRYCAENATQPRRFPMSTKTLEAAWAFLFPNGQLRNGASIRLGSGEPLLNFPLLLRLSSLIEEASQSEGGKRPSVFLTTNGTLIEGEISDWLADSGWHVKISLDGPESVHDCWRVRQDGRGTFAAVSSAVVSLADRMPERLSVTAVLCRGTDPEEVFETIARMGVRRIELVPVAHRDRAFQPGAADILSYEAFLQNYVERCLNESDEMPAPTLVRLSNCVVRVMGYNTMRVPCGAGRSFFAVGPEGDLYPCFRFIGVKDYRLGNLIEKLHEQTILSFQRGAGRTYEKRLQCWECWAAPLCGGPCFACAEMFGPGDGRPIELHCAYIRANVRAAVQIVARLREKAPERLLPFLTELADIEWPSSLS